MTYYLSCKLFIIVGSMSLSNSTQKVPKFTDKSFVLRCIYSESMKWYSKNKVYCVTCKGIKSIQSWKSFFDAKATKDFWSYKRSLNPDEGPRPSKRNIGPTNSAFLSYFKQVLPLVAPTPSSHMLQFVPNVGKKTNLASDGQTRKVTTDGTGRVNVNFL